MSFTEHLNILFGVLGCTNADIARASGIDPSLVSRYHTGSRKPMINSLQLQKLSCGIVLYAKAKGLWQNVINTCQLLGTGSPEDEIKQYLLPWNTVSQQQQLLPPKV